jgi:hypothetical protein
LALLDANAGFGKTTTNCSGESFLSSELTSLMERNRFEFESVVLEDNCDDIDVREIVSFDEETAANSTSSSVIFSSTLFSLLESIDIDDDEVSAE